MKNIFLKHYKTTLLLIFGLIMWSSCRSDDPEITATYPEIEFISASVDQDNQPVDPLVPTTVGYANNTYVIQGKGFKTLKHIYFNDQESYFNPNLVTDTHIFVTIDKDTPYSNVSNKLKLVTGYGSVEYDFTVAPPKPVVSGFNPINAVDGSQIKIKGNYFVDPVVKVGDVQAEIQSYNLTEIVATVPTNSNLKKVSVTTLSGTVTYNSQIGTSVYDDAFYGTASASGWGEEHDLAYSEDSSNIQQGDKAIKATISAWSGFQIDNGDNTPLPSDAKGIRFYAKAVTGGANNMGIIFNYSWSVYPIISVTTSYQEFRIPWSSLGLSGPPANLQAITFFTQSAGDTYYFDDIGYYTE